MHNYLNTALHNKFTVYALGEQNDYSVLFTNVKRFEHVS